MQRFGLTLITIGLSLIPAVTTRAGTILDSTYTGSSPGGSTTSASTLTFQPNNFDTTQAGPNIIAVSTTLSGSLPALVDIAFPITAPQGTTEYYVTDTITNSTNTTWRSFDFLLGSGTGANFVLGNTQVNFDAQDKLPVPTSNTFSTLGLFQATHLAWSGGTVPAGQTVVFTFSIDMPDQTATTFTLRQQTVPEPSSLVLAGIGALVMTAFLRWQDLVVPRPEGRAT